jgi:predicted CoA-binding protein
VAAFASVGEVPSAVEALSIVTPPAATRQVVADAIAAGVQRIWMQPGAEDDQAIDDAREAGLMVIAGGPCILVAMKTIARR